MMNVVLLEPEIAGNTGAVARTCLATGARLHLLRPLGFTITDAALRRAGMDYWYDVDVTVHSGWEAFHDQFSGAFEARRVFGLSTHAAKGVDGVEFAPDDVLLFGPESRGLPTAVLETCQPLRLPMRPGTRSLNLSVSVAVTLYLAWSQLGFAGGE